MLRPIALHLTHRYVVACISSKITSILSLFPPKILSFLAFHIPQYVAIITTCINFLFVSSIVACL
ncbi:hypothetical protein Hanom_Chr03g00229791 [Helianthus anomalus]